MRTELISSIDIAAQARTVWEGLRWSRTNGSVRRAGAGERLVVS